MAASGSSQEGTENAEDKHYDCHEENTRAQKISLVLLLTDMQLSGTGGKPVL